MNNEKYNQIINDAYQNYITQTRIEFNEWHKNNPDVLVDYQEDTKDLFLQSIKEDKHWFSGEKGFSEKWGLKIEERELSLKEEAEAYNIMLEKQNYNPKWQSKIEDIDKLTDKELMTILQGLPGPTKLITITYNNETIEIYE